MTFLKIKVLPNSIDNIVFHISIKNIAHNWIIHPLINAMLGQSYQIYQATFYLGVCTKPGKLAITYLCVMVSVLPLATICLLDYENVPTVW